MPKPLKELFLSLSPNDVNLSCPEFVRQNNITIMVPRENDTGSDWVKAGAYVAATTHYPVKFMDVLYRPPNTPGFSSPFHVLDVDYIVSGGPGYERRFMRLQIKYWDTDKLNDRSYHDYADWFSSLNDPEQSKKIGNTPVSFARDKFAAPANISAGTNEITWKQHDIMKEIHFTCGQFVVDLTTTMPFSVGGNTKYLSNDYWVKNKWPKELLDLSLDTSSVRIIEPLAEKIIGAVHKSSSAERPGNKIAAQNPKLEVFVSQVIDRPDFLVDNKPGLLVVRLTWENKDCQSVKTTITRTRNGVKEREVESTFKYEYSDKERLDMKDAVISGFTPDMSKRPTENQSVTVQLSGASGPDGKPVILTKDITFRVDTLGNPAINIRFIPMTIGSWDPKHVYTDKGVRILSSYFDKIRKRQMDFLSGMYPLSPSAVKDATTNNLFMDITEAKSEKFITGVTKMGLLSRLEDYYRVVAGENIQFVIGVVPSNWLGDIGLTEKRFPHVVLLDEAAPGTILAHEMGHLLGFAHNQDTYGREITGNNGFWIRSLSPLVYERRTAVLFKVNTLDFMDVDPKTENNTWVSRENYTRLAEKLRLTFGSHAKTD